MSVDEQAVLGVYNGRANWTTERQEVGNSPEVLVR